jgi:hypothetical protein
MPSTQEVGCTVVTEGALIVGSGAGVETGV